MESSRLVIICTLFFGLFYFQSLRSLFDTDHGCLITHSIAQEFNGYYAVSKQHGNMIEFKQSDSFLNEIPEVFDLIKLPPASASRSSQVPRILPISSTPMMNNNFGAKKKETQEGGSLKYVLFNSDNEMYAMGPSSSSSSSSSVALPGKSGWQLVRTAKAKHGTAVVVFPNQFEEQKSLSMKVSQCQVSTATSALSEEEAEWKEARQRPVNGQASSGGMPVGGRSGWNGISSSIKDGGGGAGDNSGGIALMWKRPSNTILIVLNMGYAYRLRSNNIPAEHVSSSYQSVVRDGEVWRMVTARYV
jgi:hypothetical protein